MFLKTANNAYSRVVRSWNTGVGFIPLKSPSPSSLHSARSCFLSDLLQSQTTLLGGYVRMTSPSGQGRCGAARNLHSGKLIGQIVRNGRSLTLSSSRGTLPSLLSPPKLKRSPFYDNTIYCYFTVTYTLLRGSRITNTSPQP